MKLSTYKSTGNTKRIDVPAGEEVIWVDYWPGAITPALVKRVAAADPNDSEAVLDSLTEAVCAIVAAWDLQDDDDQMIPLEPGPVSEVPIQFLAAIFTSTNKDAQVGEASPATSAAG